MRFRLFYAALLAIALGGCGSTVPVYDAANKDWTYQSAFVQSVTSHIHCEMRNAVLDTYDKITEGGSDAEWLKVWSAKISLTLNVDEVSTLSSGVAITSPSFFALGLGGSLSSQAQQELQIDWFSVFSEYFRERAFQNARCETGHEKFPIEGSLGLKESLFSAAFPASIPNNIANPFKDGGRLQVIQQTTFFYIKASGSINPSWKFTEVSANTGGEFISLARNRKDTLLITMGPTQLQSASRPLKKEIIAEPTESVSTTHFAKQIGNAVANGLISIR